MIDDLMLKRNRMLAPATDSSAVRRHHEPHRRAPEIIVDDFFAMPQFSRYHVG